MRMAPKSSVTSSLSLCAAQPMSGRPRTAEDDARSGAMGADSPRGVDEAAFRRRDLPADMDGLAFGGKPAGRRGDRPHIVDLDLERRVAVPGRQGRMHGAA